ncbi:Sec-independent protein translocase protein TatB [Nitriliruptor alkaliphilus]|uniref:Sec-independent protein translocase protein TatB n=1 Tax=Nitriliruptor alkaliphilus TaxID=427918 RepID=UPI00069719D6|nr:Sec-independent protein translocase protein TatB [Nitriliruptor alkaliphilus]
MPGPQELLVIAVVALLVFGPERLPELARNAAKLINRLRAETSRSVDELKRAAEVEGLDREWREVRAELKGARDELRRPFAEDQATRKPVDGRMAPATSLRPDDRPPPVDAEAT